MLINPVIPTIEYTTLLNIEVEPKRLATKLKSKRPIKPQFMAPIIVITKHIFCNVSIISPSSSIYNGHLLKKYSYLKK